MIQNHEVGAFNIELLIPQDFIKQYYLSEVTSTLIKVPSSSENHPEGIFSEEIFGQLNSPERMERFGYISLNTTIIAPPIFRLLKSIAPWHLDVMAGHTYAYIDKETNYLTKSTDGKGDTGFSFYMSVYPTMTFKPSNSASRQQRVQVLDKYRKQSLYKEFPVSPAGLRDLTVNDTGRLEIDDINKLYIQLLNIAQSLTPGVDSRIYDPIRYSLQSVAMEIYSYLDTMMSGKTGFMQGHYGKRSVALGTRNVISAADQGTARPDSPHFLKADETQIGLFQAAKAVQPATLYYLKTLFFNTIFPSSQEIDTAKLINPKTWETDYIPTSLDVREEFTSPDGIYGFINKFKSFDFRKKPIVIYGTDNKPYYAYGVYIDGKHLHIFRSIKELSEQTNVPIAQLKTKVRPLTWLEAMYMATHHATMGKFVFMTRYPVLGDGSCYPSRIHIAATRPALELTLVSDANNQEMVYYPEYPDINGEFQDGMAIAPSHLGPTGGDHDGDTMSANVTLTEDAVQATAQYMDSPRALLDTNNRLVAGQATDLVALAFFAFTHTQKDL